MRKKIISFIIALVILISLASCRGNNSNSANYDGSGNNSYDSDVLVEETDRKISYTVNYSYEGEIANIAFEIKNKVKEAGGYVSSSRASENYAYYSYKVPTDKLNDFLDYIDKIEGMGGKTTSTKDLTSTYDSFSKRIERLNSEKAIYEDELNNNPNLSVNEKLDLNYKISEIEDRIANAYSNYDKLKNDLEYSTVSINYNESRSNTWFRDFGLLILSVLAFILYAACILAPFALIGLIVYLIFRKKKKTSTE